jgi:hypothetical protein
LKVSAAEERCLPDQVAEGLMTGGEQETQTKKPSEEGF